MNDQYENLPQIIESAIFAADEPLSIDRIAQLFEETYRPSNKDIRKALDDLKTFYRDRGIDLVEVGSGFRFQSRPGFAPWLKKLWEKKPPRYSRALLETLALIIYRQPITRGEIEAVRGVAVSTNITKILLDREWIKVVGYKDVPGKPAMFATTRQFLDYFNLKSLSDLPPLDEVVDFDEMENRLGEQLTLGMEAIAPAQAAEIHDEDMHDEEVCEDIELALAEEEEVVIPQDMLEDAINDPSVAPQPLNVVDEPYYDNYVEKPEAEIEDEADADEHSPELEKMNEVDLMAADAAHSESDK